MLKTPVAARLIGVTYWVLMYMVRSGSVPPPGRDSSGHYAWSPEDIERARAVIRARQAKPGAAHEK